MTMVLTYLEYLIQLLGVNEYATFLKSSVFHLILHRQKYPQGLAWNVTVMLQPHKFMRSKSAMILLISRQVNGGDAF